MPLQLEGDLANVCARIQMAQMLNQITVAAALLEGETPEFIDRLVRVINNFLNTQYQPCGETKVADFFRTALLPNAQCVSHTTHQSITTILFQIRRSLNEALSQLTQLRQAATQDIHDILRAELERRMRRQS